MGPLVTVVLAFLILKEKIRTFEFVMIFLSIGGILIVVLGNNSDKPTHSNTGFNLILHIALFMNPVLVAGGTISMRKMKKFHEAVVSWYLNWTILLVCTTVVLIMGAHQSYDTIKAFTW